MMAQHVRAAESHPVGDDVDGGIGRLEQQLGALQALVEQPPVRSRPGRGTEVTREAAW